MLEIGNPSSYLLSRGRKKMPYHDIMCDDSLYLLGCRLSVKQRINKRGVVLHEKSFSQKDELSFFLHLSNEVENNIYLIGTDSMR